MLLSTLKTLNYNFFGVSPFKKLDWTTQIVQYFCQREGEIGDVYFLTAIFLVCLYSFRTSGYCWVRLNVRENGCLMGENEK